MISPLNNNITEPALIHSNEFLKDIQDYEVKLTNNHLPVIYSLTHFCLLAKVNVRRIYQYCDSDRIALYKRFKLKKKRGGFRVIQTPDIELKYLQRWILANILEQIPSHASCKGFDKELSIKKNAEVHLNKEALLKIDLLRFYDSINEKRVYGLFKAVGFHPNLSVSLAKLCTLLPDKLFLSSFKKDHQELKETIERRAEGILPQGAPSSPKLSNLICAKLDNRLTKLAAKNDLRYSRYADDITFSGSAKTLQRIKKVIYRIIKDEEFLVNFSKTKMLIKGQPFLVTGLSVNNASVSVRRKKKIDIEHHLFHCLKNGVSEHLKISKIKNRNFKDWLLGNIAYVYSVEKESGEKYFQDFNKIEWPL